MKGKELRIVFMGTPDFAVASLKALVEGSYNIVGVITSPDKPAGRGKKMAESAVKKYAVGMGLKVLQPEKLKDSVFLEDLQIKNMSKSARGSIDSPGTNVKAKSGLNKSIIDQGWGIFCNLLHYKLTWLGGNLHYVNPQYTSQKCPNCSHIDSENRLSQSQFTCRKCAYENHADHVGALNILAAGLAVIACQANSSGSRQQESAGNREEVLPCVI